MAKGNFKRISKELEKEIIKFYLSGKSLKDCATEFKLSKSGVVLVLKRNNITFINSKSYIAEETKNLIIKMHENGKSVNYISANLGYSNDKVSKILGGKKKLIYRKLYYCNDNYFETIDTKDKAYFLGLIVADGNNYNSYLKIALKYHDLHILETFKKYINYTGYIKNTPEKIIYDKFLRKSQNFISIRSNKLCEDLSKLGVAPNKTHKTYFPEIPEEFWSHFIRGVFDGDGCLSNYKEKNYIKYNFSIVGNKKLINRIQDILVEKCKLNKTKLITQKNSVSVCYCGNKQLLKIKEYLYKDCNDLFLIRKKEKFDKL